MRHFPAFLELHGRRALVLGSGEMAARKSEPLARAGAIVVQAERFEPALLIGCALAIGADAPDADLLALSAEAMRLGIPVNVVDRPALCSFITPALIDRDPITIAISTAGTAPVLARLLRARIEVVVPPAFGRLAALAERFAAEVRARLPDLARRRRMLERAFTGRVADLVFAGDEDAAAVALSEMMAAAEDAQDPGIIFLVDPGPGAADLLTLRALRVLGEADVIAYDETVSAAVLETARRDATRFPADADTPMRLMDLAQGGGRVVYLGRPDPALFIARGLRTECVPGVGSS